MSREFLILLSLTIIYTIWITLPLIPAVLIYRLFPSTTVAVSGPLANLTVRATGAFAAYLVVFAAIYLQISKGMDEIGTFQHPYWTIEGTVNLVNSDGTQIQADPTIKLLSISTSPSPYLADDYRVTMYVPETDKIPYLKLEVPGFGHTSLDVRDNPNVRIDTFHKTIEFKTPIIIKQTPARGSPGLVPGGKQLHAILREDPPQSESPQQ
jgi:hypothetical protein